MNKSLKILLLATTILGCEGIFASGDEHFSPPPRNSLENQRSALVRVSGSPSRNGNGLMLANLGSFETVSFNKDEVSALAVQYRALQVGAQNGVRAVVQNDGQIRQLFQVPARVVRALVKNVQVLQEHKVLTDEMQLLTNNINEEMGAHGRQILGFEQLLEMQTKSKLEEIKWLEDYKAKLSAGAEKFNEDAEALGVIFGQAVVANDLDSHTASATSMVQNQDFPNGARDESSVHPEDADDLDEGAQREITSY